MPTDRPNVLILMADQLRADALGCAGHPVCRTPNIDALAASGVHFTEACTTTPVCVAARMSFITGLRAARTRWVTNGALPGPIPELPTIMTLLAHEGWWTEGIGKMHFRGRYYGFRHRLTQEECIQHATDDDYIRYLLANGVRTRFPQGFRDLMYLQPQTCRIPERHSKNRWVADRSVEFLREHARYRADQPFMLWSSWTAPHPPFAPCEPYDTLYDPADFPLPFHTERSLADMPSVLWGARGRLDGSFRDPDRIRRVRALYHAQVTHVDHCMGAVLDELDALGLAGNTVVVLVSDHGDMMADHGLGQKQNPYEGVVRVPLLLRWPGRTEAGRRCDDLVDLTDVAPTLLQGLGVGYPESLYGPLPGGDLLGAAGGGLAGERDAVFIDYGLGRGRWVAMRTRTHTYALFACDGGCEELYDNRSDPRQAHNLASERPELAARFRERVLAWEREHGVAASFGEDGAWRTFPRPERVPTDEEVRLVGCNEGPWPKRLPADRQGAVESFAEAFTGLISRETTLSPDKLSIGKYKAAVESRDPLAPCGEPLIGTAWEEAYREAEG